ncbi:MAG: PIN domain-containing protein [Chloroflexi bacterium]|nr:PIN domain-containing protein [Chloroflexota bacterium]
MSTLLIDTNIASFVFKGDSRAALYESVLEGHDLAISLITWGELLEWTQIHGWGSKRTAELEAFINQAYRIIPIDDQTCPIWAGVRRLCRQVGRPIAQNDAWIAATALQYNLALVTHNAKDFAPIANLQLITTR